MGAARGGVRRVRRGALAACMTCPLCRGLLREATAITECLHTFCKECIMEKIDDEEVDCCPVCNINLGCDPEEKLRPDHNVQDIRNRVFPLKVRKVDTHKASTLTLPLKRKQRSLSSLVVDTPMNNTNVDGTIQAPFKDKKDDKEDLKKPLNSLLEVASRAQLLRSSTKGHVDRENKIKTSEGGDHMPWRVGLPLDHYAKLARAVAEELTRRAGPGIGGRNSQGVRHGARLLSATKTFFLAAAPLL
uniref:RING-type domain-containing protein n=1 Tax=Oryza brachyantha TaxID=4533 RepID=J3LSP7_ORYBR